MKKKVSNQNNIKELEFASSIRKVRFVAFILFFMFVPLICLINQISSSALFFGLFSFGYIISFLFISFKWTCAICPRCKKYFFVGGLANPFTSKCMNCDLNIYRLGK